jgi:hypothetical protein
LGRAEDVHAIMDAECDATSAYLDELTNERGGRRGTSAIPTATSSLVARHGPLLFLSFHSDRESVRVLETSTR